ncbi:MAG: HEAT repeat domain-containing protein [Verrucomicrobia bacterium]|nr:HEAT repeat domain-containing protein [Verrucomicrobiota bacterium]
MKCQHLAELTADYLAGRLEETSRAALEAHLTECSSCRETMQRSREMWTELGALPEVQPSPALRARVEAMLEVYREELTRAATAQGWREELVAWLKPRRSWRLAFQLAMVVLAFAAGMTLGPVPRKPASDQRTLTQLRDDVSSLRHMITLTLLRQPSASDRLQGVSLSQYVNPQDQTVLAALVQALNSDPNVNVRVAAVGALSQFASDSIVKQGLLRALATDNSPLVQIELIDLMVKLRETESIPVLKKMTQNASFDETVRQQAERALQLI